MSRLDEAFALAERVYRTEEFQTRTGFNYLTLTCLGLGLSSRDGARFAATFDCESEEWYAIRQIVEGTTTTRAATPEDAIFGAVQRFTEITKTTLDQLPQWGPSDE